MAHIYRMTIFRYNFWKSILDENNNQKYDKNSDVFIENYHDQIIDTFSVTYYSFWNRTKSLINFHLVVNEDGKSMVIAEKIILDTNSCVAHTSLKRFSLDKVFEFANEKFKIIKISNDCLNENVAHLITEMTVEHYKTRYVLPLYTRTGFKNITRWKLENDIFNVVYKPNILQRLKEKIS